MNIIERQTTLGKSLYEININAMKEFATLQKDNVEKYLATNRSFGEQLPAVKDINSLVELQRQYGATLWSNAKGSFEHQNELLRTAIEDTRDALKQAFTPDSAQANSAKIKPTAKTATSAKPKAKVKAKAKAKAATKSSTADVAPSAP